MNAPRWTVTVLGVWLAVSDFFAISALSPAVHALNALLVGAVVTVAGIMLATAALLGLWLVIAAFTHPLQTGGGHLESPARRRRAGNHRSCGPRRGSRYPM